MIATVNALAEFTDSGSPRLPTVPQIGATRPRVRWGRVVFARVVVVAVALAPLPTFAAEAKKGLATESQSAAQSATQVKAPVCRNSRALGVSRVIEIDTELNTHFGSQQYKSAEDLLRDGEVVLTFDDGPLRSKTKRVLEALDAHCTKATFFAVGRMAVADPGGLRAVATAGHTIAHHTWSHKNQNKLSLSRGIAEFELGVSAIDAVIGRPSAPFFRFPYLADAKQMQRYATARGFGVFSIDIDSLDWRTKSATRVRENVMRALRSKGKGIVLFHDIQISTAGALPELLDEIRSGGFKIVHFVSKRPTVTLPEYDVVARERLEKRNFRSDAAPVRTAFRFDDTGGSSAAANTRESQSVKPTSLKQAGEPRASTQSAPPTAPDVVERTPKAPPVDDWRKSVFNN